MATAALVDRNLTEDLRGTGVTYATDLVDVANAEPGFVYKRYGLCTPAEYAGMPIMRNNIFQNFVRTVHSEQSVDDRLYNLEIIESNATVFLKFFLKILANNPAQPAIVNDGERH